jgi:hypothetical protein
MHSKEVSGELPPASLPGTAGLKRPKRLVVIAIMNIVVALISIVAIIFLLNSSKVPAEVVPGYASAAFSMLIATAMIVTSVLAFLGVPKARRPALVVALVFFGLLLLQSLLTAMDPQSVLGEVPAQRMMQKLWAGVVRNSIEIGLNCWVFLSAKTVAFFESRRAVA